MTAKEEAVYLAYSAGWGTVRRLPEKTAYRSFNGIADRLWSRRGPGVAQLEKNLGRVVPDASYSDLRKMSRQSMRKYFRYWCDAFRMPDWSNERIVNTFDCVGEYRLQRALAENKGVIVALAHMGNWDHAGAWATLTQAPLTAVAEKLEPERLFERFVEYRESLGMQIYPLGQKNVIDTLADELRNDKRIVALVSDRDLTSRGIEVDFFGEKTRMPGWGGQPCAAHRCPAVPGHTLVRRSTGLCAYPSTGCGTPRCAHRRRRQQAAWIRRGR